MSRPPRSATPHSRAARPAAPQPAPVVGGDVYRMLRATDEDLCCLCLEPLSPNGRAAELVVRFPTCAGAGHSMHLGCVAQLRSQAQGRSDLLCPLCRHSSCPACDRGRGPLERGSVAPRARSGPGQGPARPARPPNCCQGRLVAKVVVPVGSLSAAGRCCHSIGQYVVGAALRQPGAWPRARPGSQSSGPSRLPLR